MYLQLPDHNFRLLWKLSENLHLNISQGIGCQPIHFYCAKPTKESLKNSEMRQRNDFQGCQVTLKSVWKIWKRGQFSLNHFSPLPMDFLSRLIFCRLSERLSSPLSFASLQTGKSFLQLTRKSFLQITGKSFLQLTGKSFLQIQSWYLARPVWPTVA